MKLGEYSQASHRAEVRNSSHLCLIGIWPTPLCLRRGLHEEQPEQHHFMLKANRRYVVEVQSSRELLLRHPDSEVHSYLTFSSQRAACLLPLDLKRRPSMLSLS